MDNLSGKAFIHIINNFKVKKMNQPFRCILIYHDADTGFCFVRPLLYKINLEICMELFKIFTSYRPPRELHINSCSSEMVNNIQMNLELLCPTLNMKFIKKNADNNDIAMLVVRKLHKWMEVTNKDQWEIGCCIVQREINTEVDPVTKLSPHDRYFKYLEEASGHRLANPESDVDSETVETEVTGLITTLTIDPDVIDIKEEEDAEEFNALNKDITKYQIFSDGGITFPCFSKNNNDKVNVKAERVD